MKVRERIKSFFAEKNIEYYAVLDYGDLREINKSIIEREQFSPQSVIIFLLPYYSGECENLSRYSASLDYHLCIKELNNGLAQTILSVMPQANIRGYGDHSPIDECHAALIGGLGIMGENGLLINEKYGSYIFIADLVTDIPPKELGAREPCEIKKCEGCGLCKKNCPTGILMGEGSECLSGITQRKGELSEMEIELMRRYNTVWGCDICQSSCPHNKDPLITPLKFFQRDRIPCLTSEILRDMDKATFNQRAFAWRGRKTVQRNLEHLGY